DPCAARVTVDARGRCHPEGAIFGLNHAPGPVQAFAPERPALAIEFGQSIPSRRQNAAALALEDGEDGGFGKPLLGTEFFGFSLPVDASAFGYGSDPTAPSDVSVTSRSSPHQDSGSTL